MVRDSGDHTNGDKTKQVGSSQRICMVDCTLAVASEWAFRFERPCLESRGRSGYFRLMLIENELLPRVQLFEMNGQIQRCDSLRLLVL